jgi:acyl-CoA thioester hydrolase
MNESMLSYRGTVYPWHCDHMGHMNVMFYVGKFDEATWEVAALTILTALHLDAAARKACAFPAAVRERAKAWMS